MILSTQKLSIDETAWVNERGRFESAENEGRLMRINGRRKAAGRARGSDKPALCLRVIEFWCLHVTRYLTESIASFVRVLCTPIGRSP